MVCDSGPVVAHSQGLVQEREGLPTRARSSGRACQAHREDPWIGELPDGREGVARHRSARLRQPWGTPAPAPGHAKDVISHNVGDGQPPNQGKHHLSAEYRETIADAGELMVDTVADPIDLDYAFDRALDIYSAPATTKTDALLRARRP